MTPEELAEQGYIPIDDGARNGRVHAAHNTEFYAAAYWTGEEWAHRPGRDPSNIRPIHFEPLFYRPSA